MKRNGFIFGLLCSLLAAWPSLAGAQVNAGLSLGGNGGDSFHLAIGDYFKVSEDQINDCQKQNISDEELPVVFFIAQRANVEPAAVLAVHTSGLNWMQVAMHFRLNPRIFFISMTQETVAHTPYEKGFAYYHDRKDRVNLSDGDIVNFVNLKFISEHYGYDPKEVIQMRASGKSFRDINDHYWQKKEQAQWDVDVPANGGADNKTDGDAPKPRHGHRGGGMGHHQDPAPDEN